MKRKRDPEVERETDNDTSGTKAVFSRRHFLSTAGQFGLTISAVGPTLSNLLAHPAHEWRGEDKELGHFGVSPNLYSGLRWRMLGPFRGGRVAAATGVPGRPNDFYFGAVNGGVWKTTDGGRVWTPIFDSQPVASIGAITVAPSQPTTVYVGSGESTLRDSVGYGNGVYKSVDAGRTWTHLGLDETHHIGKIAVDPRNPNVVFVAAIGKLYGANQERGVFRSTDGGRSWKKILGDENVGAVEVAIDPSNSRVIYAGLWNTRRPPWFTYAPTNGPGGGIFKSTDGGDNWTRLTNGLPTGAIGRTGIAIAPSNPNRVYAIVDCLTPQAPPQPEPPLGTPAPQPSPAGARPSSPPPGQGGFFRSDDAGATWTRLSNDPALWGRGWYFEKITVDPQNPDIVYVPNVAVNRTKDGGKTWVVLRGSPGGDDYHQPWVSPDDPNTMIVASDQGAVITRNARADDPREVTWTSWLNQPTAQVYHLSVDYRFPYWVTGAQQDSGAIAVRSRGKFAEISMHDWEPIAPGGESGYTAGDRLNPGVVYGGDGQRWNLDTNTPDETTTHPKSTEKARGDWTQPLVFSKADPHALYYANQFLFKTSDGAKTWTQISPDLPRTEVFVPPTLDATAAAAIDQNGKRGVIYTIAPSPIRAPMLWIGTDDGLIQLTEDDGKTWQNVTPAEISPWSRVTMIQASHSDANTAYASVDRHQLQDFEPYIYRTRDKGKTWQKITNGIPTGVYVHVVKEDPLRRGLLIAGTERGIHVSFDDGDSWQSLQLNLPVTSLRDVEIYNNDLIVATHGRGFWVIDDISPLRQLTDPGLRGDAFLFKPADAINVVESTDNGTPLQKDEPHAENPPQGAIIDYYLRNDASGPVTIEIADSNGAVVRRFSSEFGGSQPATVEPQTTPPQTGIARVSPLWQSQPPRLSKAAGMHRISWSALRDRPRGAPPADEGGPLDRRQVGTFTAKLTVNGKVYTQSFTMKPDPRIPR
ncbi:MAG: WD40/YVTN/BNR-like repeat-containing protein [Gemmatimonadaceae bacterium]